MNAAAEKSDKEKADCLDGATPQMKAVLDYLAVHGEMSEEDVEALPASKEPASVCSPDRCRDAG